MSGSPQRGPELFASLSMRRRTAIFVVVVVLEIITIVAAQATRYNLLTTVALAVLAVAAVSIGLRKPVVLVICYVALVPLDAATFAGDLGTLSRIVGIGVFATYALPRVGVLSLRRVGLPAWLFAGWATASIVWALDPTTTVAAISTLVQLFLMTIIVVDLISNDSSTAQPILWAYSLSAALVALFGVAGYLTGQLVIGGGRAEAFQGQDPAQFSAILVPAVVFFIWETISRDRHWPFAAGCAAVCALGILLSGTNSAWLAVAVALIFVILPRLRATQWFVLGVATLVAVGFVLTSPELAGYVTSRAELAAATGGAGRSDIWAVGATIIDANPIVGVGYANFPVAFTPDVVKATDLRGAIVSDTIVGGHQGPHSMLIGTTAELGIVGLLLLFVFLARPLLRASPLRYGVVAQAMTVAVVAQAFFIDLLQRKHFWLVLAISLGLLAAASLRRAQSAAEPAPEPQVQAGAPPRVRRRVAEGGGAGG